MIGVTQEPKSHASDLLSAPHEYEVLYVLYFVPVIVLVPAPHVAPVEDTHDPHVPLHVVVVEAHKLATI